MNKYTEEIAKWALNPQHIEGSMLVEDFLEQNHINELILKAYIYELFKAIDDIDTRLDSMKPSFKEPFVKAVCSDINKLRMTLASLGFDKRILEGEKLMDSCQLGGNYLKGLY